MKDKKRVTKAARSAVRSRQKPERYVLSLFVAGTTPHSAIALGNVVALCEERLHGRYDLSVIDVYKEPSRAKEDQVIAVPTLICRSPLPVRRFIGDLSDRRTVLAGLGLRERETEGELSHAEKA